MIYSCSPCLNLEVIWKSFVFQKTACHLHHLSIFLLGNPILFRFVGRGEFHVNVVLFVINAKLFR